MNITQAGSQALAKGNPSWFTGTVRIDEPYQGRSS